VWVAAVDRLLAPGSSVAMHFRGARLLASHARNQDSAKECGSIAVPVALLAPRGSAAMHSRAAVLREKLRAQHTQNQDSAKRRAGNKVAALVALLADLCCSGARGCRRTAQPVPSPHPGSGL